MNATHALRLNVIGALLGAALAGCQPAPSITLLRGATLTDPLRVTPDDGPIVLRAARNETVHFIAQLEPAPDIPTTGSVFLRMGPFHRANTAPGAALTAPSIACAWWQILPVPVDANHAGFVRHTGLSVTTHHLPRALLPLSPRSEGADLFGLRDPENPTQPQARASGRNVALWADLFVPETALPGDYQADCDCVENGQVVASVKVNLTVYDFALPPKRNLLMVAPVAWEDLERLWPEQLSAKTPQLINRKDARYAPAVKLMDEIVRLAQQHRVVLTFPRLGPVVKWGFDRREPPQCQWEDFDSLVGPWLIGDAFADRVGLGYWPLPRTAQHEQLVPESRRVYWQTVAGHFDRMEWLDRASVVLEGQNRAGPEALAISAEAANVLAAHPRVRATLPLDEEHLPTNRPGADGLVDASLLNRVLLVAPGLVSGPLTPRGPDGATRYLRADVPGIVPYIGAGADERETRLWAFLAFLRDAAMVQWPSPLPARSDPKAPSQPDEMVWFYPGSWFGVDQPLPTVQLKWLRRAQQDFEYLLLARQRGQVLQARIMARLMAKPVEIRPHQWPDPAYALMCGTADPKAWDQAMALLARVVLLRRPGQAPDPAEEARLGEAILSWMTPQERPILLGRATEWGFALGRAGQGLDPRTVDLRLWIDLYNAADTRPAANQLQWTGVPPAWQIAPNPQFIPELLMYQVSSAPIEAKVLLDRVADASRQPIDITFIHGDDKRQLLLRLMVPVARSEQREGQAPRIDGSLEDWTAPDTIHQGRLVRMLSRPTIQRQELAMARTGSQILSCWSARDLYFAFRVEGVEPPDRAGGRATIDNYQFRRAWGEDLAEMLLQPIYGDNTVGPLVHVICRPGGQVEIRRRLDPRMHADPFVPVAGADVRYAATVQEVAGRDPASAPMADRVWRGEIAIPWAILHDPKNPLAARPPALLKFNFVQHQNATGQSASWAGPVDYGRDERFMGLLHVREAAGMREPPPR